MILIPPHVQNKKDQKFEDLGQDLRRKSMLHVYKGEHIIQHSILEFVVNWCICGQAWGCIHL